MLRTAGHSGVLTARENEEEINFVYWVGASTSPKSGYAGKIFYSSSLEGLNLDALQKCDSEYSKCYLKIEISI